MNAKEEIKKLQQQLDNLKAELEQPEVKKGQWVIAKGNFVGEYFFRYGVDDSAIFISSINEALYIPSNHNIGWNERNDLREATPTEIETALRKEAERRGFKKGVYVDNTELGWDVDGYKINGAYWRYDELNDRLSLDSYFIYDNGNWASIVEDKVTFFDWDVDYTESAVRIGNTSYPKRWLHNTKELLDSIMEDDLDFYNISEVLTELEKLDLD